MFLFCLVFAMFCARLFICAFWSPAGKGLTSWLSFVVSSVSLSLSHWYPGSGVVLDCIDSWSLHHYLLLKPPVARKLAVWQNFMIFPWLFSVCFFSNFMIFPPCMELFLVIFQVFHDFQSLWEPCWPEPSLWTQLVTKDQKLLFIWAVETAKSELIP